MQEDGNPLEALPDDPAILRALLLSAWVERDHVVAERNELAEQNERLQHLVLKLTRLKFGAKSERWPEDQLQLALGDVETAIAQLQAQAERRDPERKREGIARRRASRGALPADLPRVEVTLTPEETNCPCCRAAMTEIGCDESQRLDVIPAQYRVIVTRRPKFACRACAGVVVQEPAPARLIEGGIPTEALVANVMVSRFADHLPLYRQAQIMARQGVLIDRTRVKEYDLPAPEAIQSWVISRAGQQVEGLCNDYRKLIETGGMVNPAIIPFNSALGHSWLREDGE